MLRQYELVERVKRYDPEADEAMINRAYVFSVQKHGSQKRASGDPYFSHPIEVAGILTDLNRSLREAKVMGEVRKITTASSHDGMTIEGWLTLPPGYIEGQRVQHDVELSTRQHEAAEDQPEDHDRTDEQRHRVSPIDDVSVAIARFRVLAKIILTECQR